jgi:DNA-binding response OmpR family regulator
LHVDCEAASRAQLEDVLQGIGFQDIVACGNPKAFPGKLTEAAPDLLFVDIDDGPDWAFGTIRGIRNRDVGDCPFVVIVALTKRPALEVVRAALAAGSDDMVVKPVTARALRERVVNQIENRKEFIATDDYVGPDRRADDRELTDQDPAAIEVPNSLRYAATGDESAASSEARIQETLRRLSIQRFYHLSQKIARIAGGQRDLPASDTDGGDGAVAVREITATLAEIDEIIGEQDFKSVVQVVGSTRQALADIEACGDEVTVRHFDLLHVHGGSIGVVLKESDESTGTLVSALEKAVAAVKGSERATEATAKPEAAGDLPGAARPGPSVQSSAHDAAAERAPEPPAKIPFMVRFKAWWEGVDPSDMAAGASK